MNSAPAAGNQPAECKNTGKCTDKIKDHLYNVGPDHGSHAALKRVHESECTDDRDGDEILCANGDAYNDRHGEDAHALRRSTQEEKKEGRQRMQVRPEALADDLICGKQFAAKVAGKKENTHDNPSQKVAENDLEKSPVAGICETRHADDGESAGLRRDDRKRNRPPGNPLVREKVCSQRAIAVTEMQAEECYGQKVTSNEQQVWRT